MYEGEKIKMENEQESPLTFLCNSNLIKGELTKIERINIKPDVA